VHGNSFRSEALLLSGREIPSILFWQKLLAKIQEINQVLAKIGK
jgi:hypothetical protein